MTEEEKKIEDPADSGSDEEEEEGEKFTQEERDDFLLTACRENNYEEVILQLENKANPLYEKDGWNPLLWAACNGNEDIVRALIKRNACAPYLNQKSSGGDEENKDGVAEEEDFDPFVKPKDARKYGKYTPLHWASYKGFFKVVWILLKEKMSPLDIDMYGNTAVHQAAAAGQLKVLECFLSRGVDVDVKNARGHTPMDLATEAKTKKLISHATKMKLCQNENCKGQRKFDFKNIRYYCTQSNKFYCKKCSMTQWVYETADSEEQERPICRSLMVNEKIAGHEGNLTDSINEYDYSVLDVALQDCNGIDIAVKLRKKAEVLHLKLEHELKIKTFLGERTHHDNYKDIRKDVERVNDMVQAAQDLDIDLDSEIVKNTNAFTSRLISERNLRKQRDLYEDSISTCDDAKVGTLQVLIDKANEWSVEQEYMDRAEFLTGQMRGNIQARATLQMLMDYPIREYPEPEDPNAKKDKKAPPKKKKKEPPFPLPEWAEQLEDVRKKAKEMENLASKKDHLKLDDGFIVKVKEQLARFKQEIQYRKNQEDELAAWEAEKAAKKAKKKK